MRKTLCLILILLAVNVHAQKRSSRSVNQDAATKEIDVVFCLDLSASTNGLIEDLKENYWQLINHSNMLKPSPKLMIGLVGFARPSFGNKSYYVKVLAGLTNNYDSLYEAIDKLRTNVEKGDQFVGQALMTAIRQTEWSKNKATAKMIFLVGNGSVNTGPSVIEDACKLARSRGIIIHTGYCINAMIEKEIKGWEKIANQSNGISSQVMVNKRMPSAVALTPKDLWKLNKSYNNTIIAYGDSGSVKFKQMNKIDSLTLYAPGLTLQSRLLYKVLRPADQIKDWDLVAFSLADDFNLYNIDRSTLAIEFSNTVGPEMLTIIKQRQEERERVNAEIKNAMADDLNEIASGKLLKEDISDEGLFGRVVIKAFLKTALNNGFWQ